MLPLQTVGRGRGGAWPRASREGGRPVSLSNLEYRLGALGSRCPHRFKRQIVAFLDLFQKGSSLLRLVQPRANDDVVNATIAQECHRTIVGEGGHDLAH